MSFRWLRRLPNRVGRRRSGLPEQGCCGTFECLSQCHPNPSSVPSQEPKVRTMFLCLLSVTIWMKLASEKQLSSQDRCRQRQETCLAAAVATSADARDQGFSGFCSPDPTVLNPAHFVHLQAQVFWYLEQRRPQVPEVTVISDTSNHLRSRSASQKGLQIIP